MKIEGIPSNINANHNHNVTVNLKLDEETKENVKDIIITVFYAGVSAYTAKLAVNMFVDVAYRLASKP